MNAPRSMSELWAAAANGAAHPWPAWLLHLDPSLATALRPDHRITLEEVVGASWRLEEAA